MLHELARSRVTAQDQISEQYVPRSASARKPILIIGHLDVVEARRRIGLPIIFALSKGRLFLRTRTHDMKGNDAILVTTLIRFHREGYRPDRDLILGCRLLRQSYC